MLIRSYHTGPNSALITLDSQIPCTEPGGKFWPTSHWITNSTSTLFDPFSVTIIRILFQFYLFFLFVFNYLLVGLTDAFLSFCKIYSGDPLPHIEYTQQEVETWGTVFREITKLYPTHACSEYNHLFPLFVENCGYREDSIPQFEDISNFLKGDILTNNLR